MARLKKLAEVRPYLRCSSSIGNWRDKLYKRTKLKEYVWYKHLYKPVVFFGLYKWTDWLRLALHRGKRTVVWCGSDCLQIGLNARWIGKIKATHITENETEQRVLQLLLQKKDVYFRPMFFNNPKKYPLSYKHSQTPHVFMHVNNNAAPESGLYTIEKIANLVPEITFHIYGRTRPLHQVWYDQFGAVRNISYIDNPNIVYHGFVPEKQFDKEIKEYQAGIRLHLFDGASEIMTKSVLMGQWPITYLKYPHITQASDEESLIEALKELSFKEKPNKEGREYYLKEFKKDLYTV